jgi:hypothetical protein
VDHASTGVGQQVDFRPVDVDTVGEEGVGAQQPHVVGVFERPHAVFVDEWVDLVFCFVGVQVDGEAGIDGLGDELAQVRLAHSGQAMGLERRRDAAVGRAVQFQRRVETRLHVLAGALVVLRDGDGRMPEDGPQARLLDGRRDFVDVEVHVREGGRPGPYHLDESEFRPDADVLGGQFRLDGPDVLLEPRVQRFVVGVAPQERHRDVGVGVHEAGDDEAAARVQFGLTVEVARVVDGGDVAAVLLNEYVRAFDCHVRPEDLPAGDEEFAHGPGFGGAALSSPGVALPSRNKLHRKRDFNNLPCYTKADTRTPKPASLRCVHPFPAGPPPSRTLPSHSTPPGTRSRRLEGLISLTRLPLPTG